MIDAWIQHPTARHSAEPIFDSLRRWTKSVLTVPPSTVQSVVLPDDKLRHRFLEANARRVFGLG